MKENITYCGYVAIIGRPNVGKSTLLNRLLGQKISITSRRPQTTRHRILGIKTIGNFQTIYVDTPGLQAREPKALNRYLNNAAFNVIYDVDVIILVVDGLRWQEQDETILQTIAKVEKPVVLAINKVDKLQMKERLLAYIDVVSHKFIFQAIVPISAQNGANVEQLEASINKLLPSNPWLFPEDQLTDRNDRFLVAEIIREKLTRLLGQELPYALSVGVEQFVEEDKLIRIAASIIVERSGQKAIVIGKQGELLKKVGTLARRDIERLLAKKVFLQLWVKVKANWSNDEKLLKSFGYQDLK